MKQAVKNTPKYIPRFPWIKTFRKPQISFRMPKITRPTRVPHLLVTIGMIFSTVLMMAGALYNLSPDSEGRYVKPMGFNNMNQPVLVHPELNDQFLIESLVAAIFFAIGVLGFMLVHYSAVIKENTHSVTSILIVGLSLIAIATFAGLLMLKDKGIIIGVAEWLWGS
jgi:hypothetical protein